MSFHRSGVPLRRGLRVGVLLLVMLASLGIARPLGSATGAPVSAPLQTSQLKADDPNFLGTVEIPSCSGSLVRWPDSKRSDTVLMLTNGHCYQPSDKVLRGVIVDQPDNRPVELLNRVGRTRATLHTARVLYSTSFKTDVGLYEMRLTYGQLDRRFHIAPLTLAESAPDPTAEVVIPSGYWREQFTCHLTGFAFKLYNQTYLWRHSLRYEREGSCLPLDGSSGSPVLDPTTRVILGIRNAGNISPEGCPTDGCDIAAKPVCRISLCEETRSGRISQHIHRRYGQQTWWLTTCVNDERLFDVDVDGCLLAKPLDD